MKDAGREIGLENILTIHKSRADPEAGAAEDAIEIIDIKGRSAECR